MIFETEPIGYVVGGRAKSFDDNWGSSRAVIVLDEDRFSADAFASLELFSHVEVIFVFDKVSDDKIEVGARYPSGRKDWPLVGIFAQRGKNRPNRLGLTTCKDVAVNGTHLEVEGLDAIDGTPVLDIKPVMREFLPRVKVVQPSWVAELMSEYW